MSAHAHSIMRKPTVLFVDDEPRVLNSMRIMFRRQYDTHFASNGAEALGIIEENDIDVIVADHRMPEMTGVELLARAKVASPRSVRILLTGYADLTAVEGSINEGEVFRFLTKPCPPDELKKSVALAANLAVGSSPILSPLPGGSASFDADPIGADLSAHEEKATEQSKGPHPDVSSNSDTERMRALRTDTVVLEPRPDIAAPPPAPSEPKAQANGLAVLVFTADDSIHQAVISATKGRVPVYRATNIVQVIKILTKHRPGVLLTDISQDKATIQTMTAKLKQHLPQLVTIAVSEHRDVLDMVWLINHGQIFRFLRKPLSPGRCLVALKAGLQHHRVLLTNPELVKRHTVEQTGPDTPNQGVLSRLSFLRGLWGSA
jgi:DNA-binding NtrC family response regulator